MATIKVPTNFNIEVEFEIPEFFRRLLAYIIDLVVLFFYIKIAGWLQESIRESTGYGDESVFTLHAWGVILLVPFLAYHLIVEILMNGQSAGKKILGLRVVNENGGRASISQFMIRWLIRDVWFFFLLLVSVQNLAFKQDKIGLFLIILVMLYFITDLVMVVASKKSQRLGDFLAKTIIIRTTSHGNIEETVFQEVSDNYIPSFPMIMQLSDKDINAIKNILETARKKGDFEMAANASEKIKSHLSITTSLSPFDFLEILLKDYNYLSTK